MGDGDALRVARASIYYHILTLKPVPAEHSLPPRWQSLPLTTLVTQLHNPSQKKPARTEIWAGGL